MKKILYICGALLMFAACGQKVDRETLQKEIEEKEMGFDYMNVTPEDVDSVQSAMTALYRKYYKAFPEDSLSPVYMQRAADMLIGRSQNMQAVALLDSIIDRYPDFEDLGGCWFLKGYAYEQAEDFDHAREAYGYFIENYPDHYLANDTRMALKYLGMSTEEMFDAIMNSASDDGLTMLGD